MYFISNLQNIEKIYFVYTLEIRDNSNPVCLVVVAVGRAERGKIRPKNYLDLVKSLDESTSRRNCEVFHARGLDHKDLAHWMIIDERKLQ